MILKKNSLAGLAILSLVVSTALYAADDGGAGDGSRKRRRGDAKPMCASSTLSDTIETKAILPLQDHLKLDDFLMAVTRDHDFDRAEAILESLNPSIELIEKLQLLGIVVAAGSERLLLNFIQRGVSTNTMVAGEIPLVCLACVRGFYAIVEMHLEHGNDANELFQYSTLGQVSLMYLAANDGFRNIIELLLAHGANPTLESEGGFMPYQLIPPAKYSATRKWLKELTHTHPDYATVKSTGRRALAEQALAATDLGGGASGGSGCGSAD